MIIAILPKENRTFAGVVQYNAQKSECLKYSNTFSDNDITFQTELQISANMNNRVKDPVFHAVLSLAPGEEIDRELVLDMIDEFMEKMGYGDQPFAVYEHFDKSHKHFHIVSSRIDQHTNKKINDSFEFKKANKITDSLIFKYGLAIVEGLHTTYGITNRINATLTYILKKKPHSFAKLDELCQESGILIKKTQGGGYVFFVPGYKKGIGSSELEVLKNGRGLASRLAANKRYRKISKNELIAYLENTLRPVGEQAMPLKEFRATLAEQGVRIKLSRSETKINGMLFYYKGFEFKGSDVGEGYAWGNLSKRIIIPTLGTFTKRDKVQPITPVVTTTTGGVPHSPLVENILRNLGKYDTRTVDNRPKKKRDEDEEEQNIDRD